MLGKGLYTLYTCIYVEMDKGRVFLTTVVFPLAIKYTVVLLRLRVETTTAVTNQVAITLFALVPVQKSVISI